MKFSLNTEKLEEKKTTYCISSKKSLNRMTFRKSGTTKAALTGMLYSEILLLRVNYTPV